MKLVVLKNMDGNHVCVNPDGVEVVGDIDAEFRHENGWDDRACSLIVMWGGWEMFVNETVTNVLREIEG